MPDQERSDEQIAAENAEVDKDHTLYHASEELLARELLREEFSIRLTPLQAYMIRCLVLDYEPTHESAVVLADLLGMKASILRKLNDRLGTTPRLSHVVQQGWKDKPATLRNLDGSIPNPKPL